jgi:hypothetical protein
VPAVSARRFALYAPWIMAVSALAALLTTIHHLHGARIYDTPGRYHAVSLAVAALTVQAALLALAVADASRLAALARTGFSVLSVLVFAVLFGVIEGGITHVVAPLLAGGYSDDEPFDLLFELTGVLQVAPAFAMTVLVFRLHRRSYTGRAAD